MLKEKMGTSFVSPRLTMLPTRSKKPVRPLLFEIRIKKINAVLTFSFLQLIYYPRPLENMTVESDIQFCILQHLHHLVYA